MHRASLSLALTMLLCARAASAQKFAGVAAGVALPVGALGKIDNPGYNLAGVWQSIPPLASRGYRLDASFLSMNRKPTIRDISERFTSLSAGAVLRFPRISVSYGYAIATAGVYNQSMSPTPIGSTSSTDLGYGLGAGWRFALGKRKAFAEIRYHKISSGVRVVPLTFGLAF